MDEVVGNDNSHCLSQLTLVTSSTEFVLPTCQIDMKDIVVKRTAGVKDGVGLIESLRKDDMKGLLSNEL